MTLLPTLFSRTSTGAINHWFIEVEEDQYRTTYGQLGGAETTTKWTTAKPTNVGRANHRDGNAQALFEAKATWKKKKDSGSFENVEDVDNFVFISPMLAKNWKDREDTVKFPVFCQPKLDGARCVISKEGAFSRKGKPWVTIPHILDELKPLFEKYPDLVLDGELYNHALRDNFNKMMSLIKKTKPTEEDLRESKEIVQFHWYDIASKSDAGFSQRSECIIDRITEFDLFYCIPVATFGCIFKEDLNKYYDEFIAAGYEGQMVRLDKPYEFKRSAGLLKRKEFFDKEYTIIGYKEGRGNLSGTLGGFTCVMDSMVTFDSPVNGTREYLDTIWAERESYIGKMATVKYFSFTPPPKSVPRFPKIIAIRDYE